MNKGLYIFYSGVDCTLPFTNSVDFILQNFGSFSPLVQLQDFSNVSRNFSAVSQKLLLSLNIKDWLKTHMEKLCECRSVKYHVICRWMLFLFSQWANWWNWCSILLLNQKTEETSSQESLTSFFKPPTETNLTTSSRLFRHRPERCLIQHYT